MTKYDLKRLEAHLQDLTGVAASASAAHHADGHVTVSVRMAQPVTLTVTRAPDADGIIRMPLPGGGMLTLRPLPEGA